MSGPFTTFNSAVRALFVAGWGTTTPIQYEGEAFIPDAREFVRYNHVPASSVQASIGGPETLTRYSGYVQITIFVPMNTGSARLDWLVDKTIGILEKKTIGAIVLRTADVAKGDTGDGFAAASVRFPYTQDVLT